jgi:EAL domain-containing protein (putative c-di-GMP-specific phosphodiesterase class I)/GGDEF domain-containing protein
VGTLTELRRILDHIDSLTTDGGSIEQCFERILSFLVEESGAACCWIAAELEHGNRLVVHNGASPAAGCDDPDSHIASSPAGPVDWGGAVDEVSARCGEGDIVHPLRDGGVTQGLICLRRAPATAAAGGSWELLRDVALPFVEKAYDKRRADLQRRYRALESRVLEALRSGGDADEISRLVLTELELTAVLTLSCDPDGRRLRLLGGAVSAAAGQPGAVSPSTVEPGADSALARHLGTLGGASRVPPDAAGELVAELARAVSGAPRGRVGEMLLVPAVPATDSAPRFVLLALKSAGQSFVSHQLTTLTRLARSMESLATRMPPKREPLLGPDAETVEGIRRRIIENSDIDDEAEELRRGFDLHSCAIVLMDRLANTLRVAGISAGGVKTAFRDPRSLAISMEELLSAGYTRSDLHRLRVTTLEEYVRLFRAQETVELNEDPEAIARRDLTLVQAPLFDSYRRLLGLLIMLRPPNEELHPSELETISRVSSKIADAFEIRNSIYFDSLTELPNVKTIRPAIVDRLISFEPFSLLVCKIISLDEIVLAKGDDYVDRCIVVLAQRILALARRQPQQVLVSRNSGEGSFTLVYPRAGEEELTGFAAALIATINEPINIEGKSIRLVANIGICHSTDIDDTDMVFNYGKLALRSIADQQNAVQVFTAAMQRAYAEERQLEEEIHDSIAERSFIAHYQPKVSCDGDVLGYEALARWERAGGLEYPGVFMAAIERMGVTDALFEIVFARVCADLDAHPGLDHVSINVSPAQFGEEGFPRRVASMLEREGADPSRFTIEVVETAMLESTYYHTMGELKRLGLRLSLDDFGTGYARYKTLLDLFNRGLVDEVKIDKEFTDEVGSPANSSFVKSISYLAKEFGVGVVVEGVETLEQFAHIKSIGPEMIIQGWLISRAVPLEETAELDQRRIVRLLTGT